MIICCSVILGSTLTSAQKLTAEVIACKASVQARYDCYFKVLKKSRAIAEKRRSALYAQKKLRQSLFLKKINETLIKSKELEERRLSNLESKRKIRQEAYFRERQGSLEKAKELAVTRGAILEAKEKLRKELKDSPIKQRKKLNRQEIMQQVEYSRSRNISHNGERYSITYGYVFEYRP